MNRNHPIPTPRATRLLLGLMLAAALPAAHAFDVTLDFSGNICGAAGNSGCGNFSEIGQSYGDQAGLLDVSYRSLETATGATYTNHLSYWSTGYSDLTDVAWGGANSTGYQSEITFTPTAGQAVTLTGFDFGDYQNRNYGSSVQVYDLSGNLLWNGGSFNPDLTALHFSPMLTSSTGLVLRWGPDGYDVGIDNIAVSITTAVPEPHTWALMALGLAGLGVLLRRRGA